MCTIGKEGSKKTQVRRRAKTFGKDVGQLRSSLHVSRHKNTTQDAIAQLVGVAKDMLGARTTITQSKPQ